VAASEIMAAMVWLVAGVKTGTNIPQQMLQLDVEVKDCEW
jgi:hypothetical protein